MQLNYSRDKYLSEFSIKTLEDRYLVGDEKSPQDAFARAALSFSDNEEHAQRLYDYASKLWFMFSTPILSNGGTKLLLGNPRFVHPFDQIGVDNINCTLCYFFLF